jgi:hypothetical protein
VSFTNRYLGLLGALLCALCLAYFYLLDRWLFSSAQFSPIFRFLLTHYDLRTAWLALAAGGVAAVWRWPAPARAFADFLGTHPVAVSLTSVAVIAVAALVVYHDYPLSMDEYAAVLQAKIFASGHLYAQLPRGLVDWLIVRGFNGSFLVASTETGRAIEHYWPGFALLLTPFEFFRAPWLCNASLAGVAIYLIYWITRNITGDSRAAGWAMLFTVASGAFMADAVSYYSMQAHLTANLLFAALLMRPTAARACGAGLVGSLALILHNPVPHTLFAIPWIVALALHREQRRWLPPLLLGYLPGIAAVLGWLLFRNHIGSVTDGVLVSAAATIKGAADGVFIWPDSALLNMRAAALVKLWLWAVPGLLMIAVVGRLRFRDNPHARLLMQSAILTFAGYLFVRFDQGHGWGYRYFHSAWGAIPVLAGCAMTQTVSGRETEPRLIAFAGAAALLNLAVVLPFQMQQINEFISLHLAQLPSPARPGSNVYFIHPRGGFYVADMVQFDPNLRQRDLFLVSHGAELDGQLMRHNWPRAIQIAAVSGADHWYLGPQERRQFDIIPPSAADR